jgi:hypothetical protein
MREERYSLRWMIAVFASTVILSLVTIALGGLVMVREGGMALLATGLVMLLGSLWAGAIVLAWDGLTEHHRRSLDEQLAALTEHLRTSRLLLEQLRDQTRLSESAKATLYRSAEREMIRAAIEEEILNGNFGHAQVLVDEIARRYGVGPELVELRERVEKTRRAVAESSLSDAKHRLHELIEQEHWDEARDEALRLDRRLADIVEGESLLRHVHEQWRQRKQALERAFLEAASKDDTDLAMELIRRLDRYLSEQEAAPLREVARGVISKQRDNLGLRFKMAVHERNWGGAILVGQEIVEGFPNSKMAQEVRDLMDELHQRAQGHAKPGSGGGDHAAT